MNLSAMIDQVYVQRVHIIFIKVSYTTVCTGSQIYHVPLVYVLQEHPNE